MSDDYKAVTEGSENSNREQDCGHPAISTQQEWEYYESGKNVPNAFDPHEWKTRRVVNCNSVGRRRAGRIKYEVDADTNIPIGMTSVNQKRAEVRLSSDVSNFIRAT